MFSSTPNDKHGIILALVAASMGSFISMFSRLLSSDLHIMQIVFFDMAIALLWFLVISMRFHTKDEVLKSPFIKRHACRGVLEFIGWLCMIKAVTLITLPMHTALSFLTPLLMSTVAVIILRESHTYHIWVALLFGVIGMLIIVRPSPEGYDNTGALLMFCAASCFTTCGVLIKKMTIKGEPSYRITFYMLLFTSLVSLPFAVMHWQVVSWASVPYILGLGLATYLQQISISQALVKTRVILIVPFIFTSLIPSSLIAYFVFSEVVDIWVIIGGLVVLSSSLYAMLSVRKR